MISLNMLCLFIGLLIIPKEEVKALEKLIEAQKKRELIIKQVDKGGGIIIVDYNDYFYQRTFQVQGSLI